MRQSEDGPSCFISYAWRDKQHREWLLKLADDLSGNGVTVHVDIWDLHPGKDVTKYIEEQLSACDFTLLICTPEYAKRAHSRKGGVGYEVSIVSAALIGNLVPEGCVIPILRSGKPWEAIPAFVRTLVFTDFRDAREYNVSLEHLLRHIHSQPAFPRPPVGPVPDFRAIYLSAGRRILDALDISDRQLDEIIEQKKARHSEMCEAFGPARCMGSLEPSEWKMLEQIHHLDKQIALIEQVRYELTAASREPGV